MDNNQVLNEIKRLMQNDKYSALKQERKRINTEILPKYNNLFSGLKVRFKETKETVTIIGFGELFDVVKIKLQNGEELFCMPEELELL